MTTINKMKTAILTIAIGLASSTVTYAQDHDNSKAPHGGKVEEAGAYHIEASMKDGKAHFYLLDGKAKSMANKGVTGSVVLQFADGTTKTVQLMAMGTDAFMVDDAKATTYTNAIVTFKIGDKTATAKFKNTASKVYTCSMCGGSFDKAGKCPKCGMDLIEKKAETKEHEHKEGDGHGHHH
jgi:rubrerythrin